MRGIVIASLKCMNRLLLFTIALAFLVSCDGMRAFEAVTFKSETPDTMGPDNPPSTPGTPENPNPPSTPETPENSNPRPINPDPPLTTRPPDPPVCTSAPTCADSNGLSCDGGYWFRGCSAVGCTTNFNSGHLSASVNNCCTCDDDNDDDNNNDTSNNAPPNFETDCGKENMYCNRRDGLILKPIAEPVIDTVTRAKYLCRQEEARIKNLCSNIPANANVKKPKECQLYDDFGVVHLKAQATPEDDIDLFEGAPTNKIFKRVYFTMQFKINQWNPVNPGARHTIFWLSIEGHRNLLGYFLGRGPGGIESWHKGGLILVHGVGMHAGAKEKGTDSTILEEDVTYTLTYDYNNINKTITLKIVDEDQEEVIEVEESVKIVDEQTQQVANNLPIGKLQLGISRGDIKFETKKDCLPSEAPGIGWEWRNFQYALYF